jgi:hypothetical protein
MPAQPQKNQKRDQLTARQKKTFFPKKQAMVRIKHLFLQMV